MNAAAAIAMPSRRFVRSPPVGEREGHAGHRQEEPGHRAAERAEEGEHDRERVAAALQREQCGQPERHADREREPAREQQRGRGHAEPDRAPARALGAEVAAGERLEERGRGHARRAPAPPAAPSSQRDRRRDDAVGGRVVAAVPLAVPDREALLAEQLGTEGVRRRGRRCAAARSGRRPRTAAPRARREPPPVHAPVPGQLRRSGPPRRAKRPVPARPRRTAPEAAP